MLDHTADPQPSLHAWRTTVGSTVFTGVQAATAQCDNGAAGLDVKQSDRIDLGGFGDSIADSSAIISPAQKISSP